MKENNFFFPFFLSFTPAHHLFCPQTVVKQISPSILSQFLVSVIARPTKPREEVLPAFRSLLSCAWSLKFKLLAPALLLYLSLLDSLFQQAQETTQSSPPRKPIP
jgi:hypothetical protein